MDLYAVYILLCILLEQGGMENKSKIMMIAWMNGRQTDPVNYEAINDNRDKHIGIIINDNVKGRLHFCCIYIPPIDSTSNDEEDYFYYSDPMNTRVLPQSIKKSFLELCNLHFKNLHMTLQDDDYNCGVYVVYILSNLITDSPIETSINGDELRQYYQILFNERHINDFDTLTSTFFSYADRFMITESEEGQLKRYVGEYENQKRRYTKKEWDDVLKKRRIAEEKKKGNDNTSTEEQNEEDELNQALLASLNDQDTQNQLLEIPEFHETMDKISDRVDFLMFLEYNNRLIGPNDPNKQRVEEEINKTEEDLNLLQQRVQSIKPLQAAMDDLNTPA